LALIFVVMRRVVPSGCIFSPMTFSLVKMPLTRLLDGVKKPLFSRKTSAEI
jgi:hypothetical protein